MQSCLEDGGLVCAGQETSVNQELLNWDTWNTIIVYVGQAHQLTIFF